MSIRNMLYSISKEQSMSPATRKRMRNRIGRGLTFEKVWATIERNAEEARERHKEAEKQMQEVRDVHKETEQMLDKVGRKIEMLNEQMGGLHNSFGEMAEFMIAPAMADLFNGLGFHITEDGICNRKIRDEKGRKLAEIDLLMGNGDYLFAIEIKTSMEDKDIEKHRKRLEILREHINKTGDRRKIQGGMAVAVMKEEDRKAILNAGFYPIEPSGIMMKTDLPEGFVPREW
jgi:hypothetical protein